MGTPFSDFGMLSSRTGFYLKQYEYHKTFYELKLSQIADVLEVHLLYIRIVTHFYVNLTSIWFNILKLTGPEVTIKLA